MPFIAATSIQDRPCLQVAAAEAAQPLGVIVQKTSDQTAQD